MLDQRRRRLADVVQMLCKCFVFAGISPPVTQIIEKIIGDRSMRKHTKILIMRQRDSEYILSKDKLVQQFCETQ